MPDIGEIGRQLGEAIGDLPKRCRGVIDSLCDELFAACADRLPADNTRSIGRSPKAVNDCVTIAETRIQTRDNGLHFGGQLRVGDCALAWKAAWKSDPALGVISVE